MDVELYGAVGDRVALPPAGFAAMGWVVAQSNRGPEEAAEAMQRVLEHVVIEMGPCDEEGVIV